MKPPHRSRALLALALTTAASLTPTAHAQSQPVAVDAQAAPVAPGAADEPKAAAPPSPSTPAVASTVPEASFRAVQGRKVNLVLRDGKEMSGSVLSVEEQVLTLVGPEGDVLAVRKDQVVRLRLLPSAGRAGRFGGDEQPEHRGPLPPTDDRHFAIQGGLLPSLMIDMQYGRWYAFASVSGFVPLWAAGGQWGYSAGLGADLPLTANKRLKLDLFGMVTPIIATQGGTSTLVAVGAGVGMHYTWGNGLTLAFKLPVVGYSVQPGINAAVGTAVANFYLGNLLSLPLLTLGYRF